MLYLHPIYMCEQKKEDYRSLILLLLLLLSLPSLLYITRQAASSPVFPVAFSYASSSLKYDTGGH